MVQAQWQWEHFGVDSRMPGTAAKDGMDDTAFTVAELMAREITQNSDDAMDVFRHADFPDHKPRLTFRFVELKDDAKKEFVQRLNLADLRTHAENIVEPRDEGGDDHFLRDKTCLKAIDKPKSPLRLLYIEEQGGIGLVGDPEADPLRSRWFNALQSLGVSEQSGTSQQSGGTYGFGKAAFQLGSNLGLVVAYSNLYVTDPEDPVNRRLGGYIYQRTHELEGDDGAIAYSGFAKFGETRQADGSARRVRPFVNEQAAQWAELLGMSRDSISNDVNSFGTTFLLVDPVPKPEELVAALETYWWPAILSHSLSVLVVDYEGNTLNPRPRRRADLQPFLQSWSIATGKSEPSGRFQHKQVFQRLPIDGKHLSLGTLAAVADPDKCFERPEGKEASVVALIRQRKMVVQYAPFFENREPYVDGVLYTDRDIESSLAKAEPKEHNIWWLPQGRAIDKASPNQREIVETLYRRCKHQLTQFRSRLRPEVDEDHLRLDRLSRKLGALLKTSGRKSTKKPPQGKHGPVAIHMPRSAIKRFRDADGRLRFEAPVSLRLAEGASGPIDVEFKGHMNIVEDTGRHGDAIDYTYESVPKQATVADGVLKVQLVDKPCSFVLKSAPVDGPYSVGIDGWVTSRVKAKQSTDESHEDEADGGEQGADNG